MSVESKTCGGVNLFTPLSNFARNEAQVFKPAFSILLPLYYCFGDSIQDKAETKNRVKTGFVVAAGVYAVFSAGTCALAWPLIKAMGQDPDLYLDTVDYVRLELAGVVFGSLSKFLLLVFVMHRWNAYLYLSLAAQMVASSGFDYAMASQGASLMSMNNEHISQSTFYS